MGADNNTNTAPSIISIMISMFLNFGEIANGAIAIVEF